MDHAVHCKMSLDYFHGTMNRAAFSHLDHIDTLVRHAASSH